MAGSKGKSQNYTLDNELFIQDIYRVTDELKKLSKRNKTYTLDFSQCERVDLAIIQILLSFCIQAIRDSKTVKIQGPLHPNLGQVLEDADLVSYRESNQFIFPQINNGGYPVES